jgi:hypothetical protein
MEGWWSDLFDRRKKVGIEKRSDKKEDEREIIRW